MSEPQAPRFHAYLEYVEGRPVLTMRRATWDAMKSGLGTAVAVDVTKTPVAAVARDAAVVAAMAEGRSTSGAEVVIYRYDEKDKPKPYNVDRYSVWENLRARTDLHQLINAASTQDNQNFRSYVEENIFLVKKDPGANHHLPELPAHVIIRST